ncbi:MAG: hypothetical protein Q9161_005399 [Pseudevernia consocians]
MALEHTAACTIALPREIWRIVLHSFGTERQDLIKVWRGCRGVSKHFKHEVEELFIADYLPRTSLLFDITTSQGFNRNSRIEFHDHQVQTFYNRISVDRAQAFFRAKDYNEAKFLEQMHNGGGFFGPSHVVDLWRPSDDIALPGIFFHANGDFEIDWKALFAAVFAEEKYYYTTGRIPVNFPVSQFLSRKALIDDQMQVKEENASETISERRRVRVSTVEQGFRKAEIFESNMSKATQAEAPRARLFHMVFSDGYHTALK